MPLYRNCDPQSKSYWIETENPNHYHLLIRGNREIKKIDWFTKIGIRKYSSQICGVYLVC